MIIHLWPASTSAATRSWVDNSRRWLSIQDGTQMSGDIGWAFCFSSLSFYGIISSGIISSINYDEYLLKYSPEWTHCFYASKVENHINELGVMPLN